MTQDEQDLHIGRTVRERHQLEKKVACLQDRLRGFVNMCSALTNDPYNEELMGKLETAEDPRDDLRELKKSYDRLNEIKKLLG